MHTISEQLFLVNGKESRLTIEPDSIAWRAVDQTHHAAFNINNYNKSSSSSSSSPLSSSPPYKHDTDKKLNETTAAAVAAPMANRLRFAQLIGTNLVKRGSSRKTTNENNKRFKIYYANDNESRSSSQLLKFKSLTIESLRTSPDNKGSVKQSNNHGQQATAGTTNVEKKIISTTPTTITTIDKPQQEAHHQFGLEEVGSASEPPSCYASEGSTGHLSSLSACSSLGVKFSHSELSQIIAEGQSHALSLDELCRLIEARLERERKQQNRPRRLLIFVNPYGGKGKAVHLYKSKVSRLLAIAKVESKLVITKHANHARDTIEDPMFNVEYFDAIICIGGDGMFSELMNGLLFRYNREKILAAKITNFAPSSSCDGLTDHLRQQHQQQSNKVSDLAEGSSLKVQESSTDNAASSTMENVNTSESSRHRTGSEKDGKLKSSSEEYLDLESLRNALGGIGQPLVSPPLPIGVIGAGSTDANSFGLIGTNDVITATLNIILGKQIHIDICSIHSIEEDRLLRFVSTFVAYGYFGDVVRESEKLRWLGPSRYDVTGVNNLLKNRAYQGRVRILVSDQDGSPKDHERCHTDCELCNRSLTGTLPPDSELKFIERKGPFVGVNAAITACRCPQTKKGFSPNNHLANGCADLILVRPCSRIQYVQYLLRTGWTKKSAFDLKYVEAYRCRQFEFFTCHHQQDSHHHNLIQPRPLELSSNVSSSSSSAISSSSASNSNSLEMSLKNRASNTSSPSSIDSNGRTIGGLTSSWNVDGEILDEASIRVKVNNRLLRVFGTGEPNLGHPTH